MEKQPHIAPRELQGGRILRLMTLIPNEQGERSGATITREEAIAQFALGDGLVDTDTVMVNGENVLHALPRPNEFGNHRLGLLDILDRVEPHTTFSLTVDKDDPQHTVAAD